MSAILSYDVGGTHVTAALVDSESWRVIEGTSVRRDLDPAGTADEILDGIADAGKHVADSFKSQYEISSVWGAGMPGPFNYLTGVGLYHEAVAKFQSLYGVNVRGGLLDRLPDAEALIFTNDANAFVIGEWTSGAVANSPRVAGITLGTGVGSCFLLDGRPVVDQPGVPPAGEVYKLTISGQPLEDVISRRAILARYVKLSRDQLPLDVKEICELARNGNLAGQHAVADPLRELGMCLAPHLIDFGATAFVVGGSIAKSWDIVGPALNLGLKEGHPELADLIVEPAQWFDESGLVGAARNASDTGVPHQRTSA